MNKMVSARWFLASLIFLFAACFFLLSVSAMGNKPQETAQDKAKAKEQWDLYRRNPDAMPWPEETSFDVERMAKAKSLREIYDLARRMDHGTPNDAIVLERTVIRFLKSCCETYNAVVEEARKAGFTEIHDITEATLHRPEGYNVKVPYDKVISSIQIAGVDMRGLLPATISYHLTLFFYSGKLVAVSCQVWDD